MRSAGIVTIDREWKWAGGRYYLHHLIRCVAALPPEQRVELHDVWWGRFPGDDAFSEVRSILGEPVVVSLPASLYGRSLRKIKRALLNTKGASDLFEPYCIDVFFPIPPCDNAGLPYVFWLPDFQYLRRPDLMSEQLCGQLEDYYQEHVYRASRIVLSSEDARNDFARAYPDELGRTHVVRFCSVPDDDWWRMTPASVAEQYQLPERFFIVCNQFTRHKNHMTLLRAMHILAKAGGREIHLACTGSTFDHREEDCIGRVKAFLAEHHLEARVHILGLIPRAEQIALLRQSIAVLQPSWFEGWSTIIEDAKALGKPVLASDLPVHREQLAALQESFLPLDDAEQWVDAMKKAWETLDAGPNSEEEGLGQARLKVAQRECGMSFVQALRAASHPVS